jgi:hypothetical protein
MVSDELLELLDVLQLRLGLFEIGLCIAQEGGMAIPAVWRQINSSNPNSTPKLTGGTPVLLS